MTSHKDRAPRLDNPSSPGVLPDTQEGRDEGHEVSTAATVEFEEHAHNMHILGLIRDEPAWALARILRCEALEARRHYTRRMLQALDIYWFCAEGLPKGRYPRGRYTAEDWWN